MNLKYIVFFVLTQCILNSLFAQKADYYINKGDSLVNARQYKDAEGCYTKAISIEPNNKSAYYKRGLLYGAFRMDSSAMFDLSKAIAIDPNYKDALLERAQVFQNRGDSKNALKDLDKVIESSQDVDADIYYSRGYQKYNLKDFKGALADYQIAHKKDSTNNEIFLNLANTEVALQEYEKAMLIYNKILKTDTANGRVYGARAYAEFYLKDNYNACMDWSRAANLGMDWAKTAMQQYFPWFTNAPQNTFQGLFEHANLVNADAHEEKLRLYTKALAIYKIKHGKIDSMEYEGAVLDRANEYVALKQYDNAQKDYDELIKIYPKSFDIYYQLGCMENARENYKKAITYYSKAIELDTINVTVDIIYYGRALAKSKIGDKVGACEDIDKYKNAGGRMFEFVEKICPDK